MSAFVERPVEVSKTEWLESIQRLQVSRSDMNRLVMNYLVTGSLLLLFSYIHVVYILLPTAVILLSSCSDYKRD